MGAHHRSGQQQSPAVLFTTCRSFCLLRHSWSAGANKGIGRELAVQLLRDGRPVIAACRTQQKGPYSGLQLSITLHRLA